MVNMQYHFGYEKQAWKVYCQLHFRETTTK